MPAPTGHNNSPIHRDARSSRKVEQFYLAAALNRTGSASASRKEIEQNENHIIVGGGRGSDADREDLALEVITRPYLGGRYGLVRRPGTSKPQPGQPDSRKA